MFYYVYILKSEDFNKLYIGSTSNLQVRLSQHNSGRSKATKPFLPYELIFYEAFLSKKDAVSREEYLKSGWGLKTIKKMPRCYFT